MALLILYLIELYYFFRVTLRFRILNCPATQSWLWFDWISIALQAGSVVNYFCVYLMPLSIFYFIKQYLLVRVTLRFRILIAQRHESWLWFDWVSIALQAGSVVKLLRFAKMTKLMRLVIVSGAQNNLKCIRYISG